MLKRLLGAKLALYYTHTNIHMYLHTYLHTYPPTHFFYAACKSIWINCTNNKNIAKQLLLPFKSGSTSAIIFPMSLNGPGNPRSWEGTANCPCRGCRIPSCLGWHRVLELWYVVMGAGGSICDGLDICEGDFRSFLGNHFVGQQH